MGSAFRLGLTIVICVTLAPANFARCAPADEIVAADNENALDNAVDFMMRPAVDPLEKIDNLERASEVLRDGKIKFGDGAWKLTAFYGAVLRRMPSVEKDPFLAVWREGYPQSPTPYIIDYELQLQSILGDRVWALVSLQQASQSSKADPEIIDALRRNLIANKSKVSSDPNWYTIWSRLSLLTKRDDTEFIRTSIEGIKRNPTYGPGYDAAAEYFLPKWGGSSLALDRWARIVSKETADSPGTLAYARTYSRAIELQYGNAIFPSSRIDWEDFKRDATSFLATYPALRNVAQFTRIACLAGDHEEARRLVKLNPKSSYLGEFLAGDDRQACVDWAATPWWVIGLKQLYNEYRDILFWIVAAVLRL